MGTAAGVDLAARRPDELCGLFDLEPRDAASGAERAELLVELAGARECLPLPRFPVSPLPRCLRLHAPQLRDRNRS